ncbi:hypothetical protein K438DRAFT_2071165 [Mycena galopus ATCC 62051]|nr:hypothetical protein K438DRAFT_2071165 [Mycena galopus ATCC 62051]
MRRYQLSLKTSAERNRLKAAGRQQHRKYELFHRRRYLAYTFKPLQKHINMLEQLGVDGMSSDESDTEDIGAGTMQYQILAPQWRANHIAGWLRIFDSLHNILRRNGNSQAHLGSFPRRRKVGQRRSKSTKFVSGLPINVYDPRWITADLRRKYDLQPSTEHYDFTHESDIIQYVEVFAFYLDFHSLLHRIALQDQQAR